MNPERESQLLRSSHCFQSIQCVNAILIRKLLPVAELSITISGSNAMGLLDVVIVKDRLLMTVCFCCTLE